MTLVSPVIDVEGKVIITGRETAFKVKNIKRNPQISLLVYGEQYNGSKYIQIDGKAEVIPHERGGWDICFRDDTRRSWWSGTVTGFFLSEDFSICPGSNPVTPTIFSLARGSESAKCGDPIHALVSEVSSAYAQREPVWALQRGLKLCALKPRCLFALETSIMQG